ncbi:unnamed protein product [Protopolystoma xenopodis]|uniref:Uncharacterized protein n=1 Tax=Protopolystoma xenopodis TaxID=117903 RepID=A0A3S5C541_9PLAT|nr:unnamed protein product [Protopolystoma xenopodis]
MLPLASTAFCPCVCCTPARQTDFSYNSVAHSSSHPVDACAPQSCHSPVTPFPATGTPSSTASIFCMSGLACSICCPSNLRPGLTTVGVGQSCASSEQILLLDPSSFSGIGSSTPTSTSASFLSAPPSPSFTSFVPHIHSSGAHAQPGSGRTDSISILTPLSALHPPLMSAPEPPCLPPRSHHAVLPTTSTARCSKHIAAVPPSHGPIVPAALLSPLPLPLAFTSPDCHVAKETTASPISPSVPPNQHHLHHVQHHLLQLHSGLGSCCHQPLPPLPPRKISTSHVTAPDIASSAHPTSTSTLSPSLSSAALMVPLLLPKPELATRRHLDYCSQADDAVLPIDESLVRTETTDYGASDNQVLT